MKRTSFSHWFGRRAVPAIVAIIAISFIIMAGFLIQIGTASDARVQNRTAAFVEAAFEARRAELERVAKDYAGWGEAYRNLHPIVNRTWAYDAANMGPTLFEDFGINFIAIVGPRNTTTYSVIDGEFVQNPVEEFLDGGAMLLIERARDSRTETVPVSGILTSGGIPVITTAAVISPGEDPSVKIMPGKTSVLLLGYALSDYKLIHAGDSYYIPQLRVARDINAAPADGVEQKVLFTEDGARGAVLEWKPDRPGRALLKRILPWLGFAATLLALLTYLILRYAFQSARLLDRSARRLAVAHAKAEHLAMHDVVTGLPNRAMLMNHLDEVLRENGYTSLLFLDLDRFKPVNDALGHHAGDDVLIELARRLKSAVRETDLVARVGGDEFVVASKVNSPADAEALCRRLCELTTQPFAAGHSEAQITVSIGAALAPKDARTPHELIQRADIAMYQAKNQRRGSYRFYSPEMNELVLARRALEIDMRHAIEEKQFVLYYQPRFETSTLKIAGVEALLRWKHPEKGIVLPSEFIPLAEETGIINTLGLWALRNACFAMAKYDDLLVSVNLSPAQFRGGDVVAQVRQALKDSGLPANRLELEVTEGLLVDDPQAALKVLRELKALGVHLAMDDFGTGYSSLGYLQTFPFDRLKIDQAFVAGLTATSQSRSIVQAILALANALKITVTAEGVETQDQFMLLRADRCQEIQGFLLAKPMPVKSLMKVLEKPPSEFLRKLAA